MSPRIYRNAQSLRGNRLLSAIVAPAFSKDSMLLGPFSLEPHVPRSTECLAKTGQALEASDSFELCGISLSSAPDSTLKGLRC